MSIRSATIRTGTLRPAAGELTRRPAVRSSRTAPALQAPVRLTPRGRLVVVLAALVLALAAMTLLEPHSAATGQVGVPVRTRTVEVGSGDTLWGIASRVAKPGQVRDMVQRIEELNTMTSPSVTVGEEIAVPVG